MVKKRVLVVEDEEKVREILRRHLEQDYEVLVAQDGQEGVSQAKAHHPDLILLDLRMPRMDGLSMLRVLKTVEETVGIPVVVLSAIGESGSLLDAQMLGACDYLIKPVDMAEMREIVQRYIA
ncbi:MAG: response regulator [Candidatus Omnitrophica bacterium]|nr:response regulator [Candidatus Omnitrophota bacterium]